jgi:hypothetical protein
VRLKNELFLRVNRTGGVRKLFRLIHDDVHNDHVPFFIMKKTALFDNANC